MQVLANVTSVLVTYAICIYSFTSDVGVYKYNILKCSYKFEQTIQQLLELKFKHAGASVSSDVANN